MALDPITRQEQIIAGKDLEPITRMEKFLKQYGGGGGASSADVFIIHSTADETYTNAQFDKTTEQIFEAYQSGKYCLVGMDGAFVPVVSVRTHNAQTIVICSGVELQESGQGHIINSLFVTTDGVTWSIEAGQPPVLCNVCFDRLKIVNQKGIPYTISVDANGNITATR